MKKKDKITNNKEALELTPLIEDSREELEMKEFPLEEISEEELLLYRTPILREDGTSYYLRFGDEYSKSIADSMLAARSNRLLTVNNYDTNYGISSEDINIETLAQADDGELYVTAEGGSVITGFNQVYIDEVLGGVQPTEIVIPSQVIPGVDVIAINGYAFASKNLTKVNLPESLIEIGFGAFQSNNLTEISLPESLVEIGAQAFYGNNLTEISLPESVVSVGRSAFYGNKLTEISLPESLVEIGNLAFMSNNLTEVSLPESVVNVGEQAFSNNKLTSIVIPDSVTDIKRNAFHSNPGGIVYAKLLTGDDQGPPVKLRGYTFPLFWELHIVEPDTGNLFTFTDTLDGVKITGFNQDYIDEVLDGVTPTNITIPSEVQRPEYEQDLAKNVVGISAYAFANQNLESVVMEPGVEYIEDFAFVNNNITALSMAETVKFIGIGAFNNNNLSQAEAYFYQMLSDGTVDMSTLVSYGGASKTPVLPNNINTINEKSFSDMGLTKVTFNENLNTIGSFAFEGNELDKIHFSGRINTIGEGAFANNKLTEITILDSVTSIGSEAFSNNIGGIVNANQLIWDSWPTLRDYTFGTEWRLVQIDVNYKKIVNKVVLFDKFDQDFESPIAVLGNISDVKISEKLNDSYTLDFSLDGDQNNEVISTGNYVMINEDIFKIRNVSRSKSTSGVKIDVSCDHIYFEMLDDYIDTSWKAKRPDINDIVKYISKYTRFSLKVDPSLINNDEYPRLRFAVDRGNPIDVLVKLTKMWGVELYRYRRQVHILPSYNKDKLRLLATEKNINSLSRKDDDSDKATRIYPKGGYNLSIKGMLISDIPYPITNYRPDEGYLEVSYGEGFAKGIIYFKDGVITEPYINTIDHDKYPYPKKLEVTDTSIEEPSDLLGFGIRELNNIGSEVKSFSVSVEELEQVNGELERFGIGCEVILKDDDILFDEEKKYTKMRITEYSYYPLEKYKLSSVTIGEPGKDIQTVIASLLETQRALEAQFDGIVNPEPEPEPVIPEPEPPIYFDDIEMYTYGTLDDNQGQYVTGFNQAYLDEHNDGEIPNEIAVPPVIVGIGPSVFKGMEFDRIVLPEGTLIIMESAFENTKCKSWKLPDSLTKVHDKSFKGSDVKELMSTFNLVEIGAEAFMNSSLNKVVIGDLVSKVSNSAFRNCAIRLLALGENLITIDEFAFENNYITSLTIPEKVSSINSSAFAGNLISKLTLNSDSLRTIGASAFQASLIRDLVIPNSVTTIGESAFTDSRIEKLVIGEGLTRIEAHAFSGNNLTNVVVPENVKYVGDYSFKDNPMSTLDLHDNIDYIGYGAFQNTNITYVNLPVDISGVMYGDEGHVAAFAGAPVRKVRFHGLNKLNALTMFTSNPTEIIIAGNTVKEIPSSYFEGAGLTSVELESGVESISSWAFRNNNISELLIPSSMTSIGSSAFANNEITSLIIPDKLRIWNNAFENNKIENLEIGLGVTLNGAAFAGNLIRSLTLRPDLNPGGAFENNVIENLIIEEGVRDIPSRLLMNNVINKLTIPSTVKSIDNLAFADNRIDKIIIPNNVNEVNNYAFRNNLITEVIIINKNTKLNTGAFADNLISNLTLPDGILFISGFNGNLLTKLYLNDSIIEIGSSAFSGNNIWDLKLPSNLQTIGFRAFADNSIVNLDLPETVTTIDMSAFKDNMINHVKIPENVTKIAIGTFTNNHIETLELNDNLKSIDGFINSSEGPFANNRIEELVLPTSLTSVGGYAFYNNNLNTIVIPDSVTTLESGVFGANPGGTVYANMLAGDSGTKLRGYTFDPLIWEIKPYSEWPGFDPTDPT